LDPYFLSGLYRLSGQSSQSNLLALYCLYYQYCRLGPSSQSIQ
jgi:hypothetical protein